MKYQFIFLVIAYHICNSVDGRYVHEDETNSEIGNNIETKHVSHRSQRHSRSRRQSYHGNYLDNVRLYKNIELDDYLREMTFSIRDIAASMNDLTRNNQYHPFSYQRRDYTYNCEEPINKILAIVQELAIRAKIPPSPPPPPTIQLVYIPYPVFEKKNNQLEKNERSEKNEPENNVQPEKNKQAEKKENKINIGSRINVDDPNMIWMDTPREMAPESEEEDDGSRPVIFKPVPPKKYVVSTPKNQKRSYQEEIHTTTLKPLQSGSCEGAILYCCAKQADEWEICFANYNCTKTYKTGMACEQPTLDMVIEKLSKMYGPSNGS